MPELQTMEKEKTAGFVDRGYNHAKKQKRIEEEEAEIARLEAKERGEKEPRGKVVEDTQVQDTGDTQQEEAQEETKAQEDDSGLDAEEKSFKKRYGDLRRHMQDKEKEWNERLVMTKTQKENLDKQQKDRDDAAQKAKEMFGKAESRLQELDDAHSETLRLKAENVIRKSHEDFDELKQSDEFHTWADEQPKWVRDALYENADDPASVVRVIDLYKVDNGMTPSAKRANTKAAASTVKKGSRTSIDAKGSSGQIKESDVARMTSKEFEDNQDAINEALRKGKFVYDMTRS